MNYRKNTAAWAAIAALSLTGAAAFGADATTTSTTDTSTTKGLGHVERANKLIGKHVTGSDNQKLGKIDNLVLDLQSGHVLYAVVDTGLTGKSFAVPPELFTDVQGDTVRANLDKAKLESSPQFTKDVDKPEQLGQASFISQVYQHFGQNAWWQGPSAPANTGTFNNVHKAKELIGMNVKNVNNEDVGEVNNTMIDLPAGRVTYVILQPDRNLKLGNNLYALPPDAFAMGADHKTLGADLTKEKLAGAPHFSKDNWATLSDPQWASQVYQYYGKQAYFQNGGLQPTGRK